MKILFLAPQPFFQERGTPIAIRLVLDVLLKRADDSIEVLTYHEGSDVPLPGVTIHRISTCGLVAKVGPGISIKKLVCDFFFFFHLVWLIVKNRSNQFAVIHAVEESVFMALFCKWVFGIPYIYDMDSSLALQVTEKWRWTAPLQPVLNFFEGLAIKNSLAVVPVCDALEEIAKRNHAPDTQILRDISLLDMHDLTAAEISDIRTEAGIASDSLTAVYIGNLEAYQGIDLLIDSFARVHKKISTAHIIIIGGSQEHIDLYTKKAQALGTQSQVHFLGPKPVEHLKGYLCQGDILLSPRTLGNNTPMKIYSYLHSGIPTLATRLPTHTQVLDDSIALLADPSVDSFAAALEKLFKDRSLRERLGSSARTAAELLYTFPVFEKNLNNLYDRLQIATPASKSHSTSIV